MRILYHHRTLSKDGQNVHIEELIAAFRRAGHDVLVVGPSQHGTSEFGSEGGALSHLRHALPRFVAELLELAYSLVATIKLLRAAWRFAPDVVYERHNLYLVAGPVVSWLIGKPLVLEVNAPLAMERAKGDGLALRRLATWLEETVWRAADIVLPVTSVLGDILIAAGVDRARIMVMPNGISTTEFASGKGGNRVRSELGLGDRIVIGFTGFVRAWHGLPVVVDVMSELAATHDIEFLIVGEGPGLEGVLNRARELNVANRVRAVGLVPRNQIADYVAAFDIAVQPQATAYASPLKLFEYMALERAVLAPDQPNIREILTHNVDAVLFAPDQPLAMKTALARLVGDAALRNRLGRAASATIRARDLTWDGNARRIVERVAAPG